MSSARLHVLPSAEAIARAVVVALVVAWLLGQTAGVGHRVAHGFQAEHAPDHVSAHALHGHADHAHSDHTDSVAEHEQGGSLCELLDQLGLADALHAPAALAAMLPTSVERRSGEHHAHAGRSIGPYQARAPPVTAA